MSFTPINQQNSNPQYINPSKPRLRRGTDVDSLYELPKDDLHLASSFCERKTSSAWSMKGLPGSVVRDLDASAVQNHETYSGGSGAKRRKLAANGTSTPTDPSCNSFVGQPIIESPLDIEPENIDPSISQLVAQGLPDRTTKKRVKSSIVSSKSEKTGPFKAPSITKPSVSKGHKPVQIVASSNSTNKSHGWTTTEDTLKYTTKSFAIAKTTLDNLAAFRFKGASNNASLSEFLLAGTKDTAGNAKQSEKHNDVPNQSQVRFSHRLSGSNDLFEVANPSNRSSSQIEILTHSTESLKEPSLLIDSCPTTARNLSGEAIWGENDGNHFVSSSTSTEHCPTSGSASEETPSCECETARYPRYPGADLEAGSILESNFAGAIPSQKLVLCNEVLDFVSYDSLSTESRYNIRQSSSSEPVESHQVLVITEACMQEQKVPVSAMINDRGFIFDKDMSVDIQKFTELHACDENELYYGRTLAGVSSSCDVSPGQLPVHYTPNVGYDSLSMQVQTYETSPGSDGTLYELKFKLNDGPKDFEIEAYDEGVSDSDLLELVQDDLVSKTPSPAASDSITKSRTRVNLESTSLSSIASLPTRDAEPDNEDEYAMDAEEEEDLLNFSESPNFCDSSTLQSCGANDRTVQTSPQTPSSFTAHPVSLMLQTNSLHIDNNGASSSSVQTQTLSRAHADDRTSLHLFDNPVSPVWQDASFATSEALEGNTASEIDAKLRIFSMSRLRNPDSWNPANRPPLHTQLTTNRINDDLLYPPLPRFARPNFPILIRDRSPIIGLSSQGFIRTCFRIGEMYREMYREGKRRTSSTQDAIIELFARVTHSTREASTTVQHFKFTDLWSAKPPFPDGFLKNYKATSLANVESKVFIDTEKPKMARCLGRLKRDPKNALGWVLHVINIRETDWEEIRYTRTIVSAGSVES